MSNLSKGGTLSTRLCLILGFVLWGVACSSPVELRYTVTYRCEVDIRGHVECHKVMVFE
ncbi:hypothetical protein LCGC14_0252280 [marine sediment metagenome]|uniref:Uncharacterized protein n=1 Tax=marine sediment metagenome TaxID=412755 RepID=A0A0F9WPP0_9ZZZZ